MEDFDFFAEFETEDATPMEESSAAEPANESAETTADPVENAGEEKVAAQETKEADATPKAPETIDFKHNHESKALDKAAAESIATALGIDIPALVDTIQKGLIFDDKSTKLNALESRLDDYGKRLNMDREGLFGMLENAGDRAAMRSIAAVVQAEHPDWNAEAVQEISKARLAEQKRQNAETAAAQEQQKKEEELRPFQQFFMRHTDITPDTMPDEMKTDIFERGFTPEEAYQKYQNTQKDKEIESIKAQLAQMQKDAENRAKSIGSVSSEVGSKSQDDMLNDFFNDFG